MNHSPQALARIAALCCFSVLALIGGWAVSLAQDEDPSELREEQHKNALPAEEPAKPPAGRRLREGTRVEGRVGYFKLTGKRWSFVPAGTNERFTVLENLALERIARILNERPDSPTWRVAGMVTEFQGVNYLLIEHVVFISTPEQGAGQQWSGEEKSEEPAATSPDSAAQG
jgi:hypothetical protein